MQVKVLYEPIAPADIFQDTDVLVLPIFVDKDTYSSVYFNPEERRQVILDYLNSRNVTFIGLPDNLAIMFLAVRAKHNKRKILKHAERLYMSTVTEDYSDFDLSLPGLRNVHVTPANGEPLSCYMQLPSSRNQIIIYTGDIRLDKFYRSKVRTGEFGKYTPDSLAHPTVRCAFERVLMALGRDMGYDVEIANIVRHRHKALITCDAMELEAI